MEGIFAKRKALYAAFNPQESLQPDDPRWIDFNKARGRSTLQSVAECIRLTSGQEGAHLVAGHRGIGKTTELFRLKKELETTTGDVKPYKVIYLDVEGALDLNDIDFPDILVFIAGKLEEEFGTDTVLLQQVKQRLKDALNSRITITGAELSAPFLSLSAEIRNQPNIREHLRAAIEAQSTSLIHAVNDLILATNQRLATTHQELALIIDGLDKVIPRTLQNGYHTHDRIFIDRAPQLCGLRCHTIYSLPISLVYSSRCAMLQQCAGQRPVTLPMVSIRGRNKSKPDQETDGMKLLREAMELRCKQAEMKLTEVFADEDIEYLSEKSGGHIRHLMMFVRDALASSDKLPMSSDVVKAAVQSYANALKNEIPRERLELLKSFDQPQLSLPKDRDHLEMLDLLHIYEYMNNEQWYEVNPVVRLLKDFQNEK